MGNDKVILRSILSTVAAIFVLFVIMFATLAFVYPSTMMKMTYDLGMYSASVRYAKRTYDRNDEIYYIAFATEVAIMDDNVKNIASCGSRFIKDDGFDGYADERNERVAESLPDGVDAPTMDYRQYVYGNVCVAKYKLGKKTEAIENAFLWNGDTFTENNAVVAVLMRALGEKDNASVDEILTRLQTQKTANATEQAYLQSIVEWTKTQR